MEQDDVLTPNNLFQRTPPLSFAESPSLAPFELLSEYRAPPTATEEVNDFEEEEEQEEQVFLDPLKMDAGNTPFQRKRKIPSCKRLDCSGGRVKIKTLKLIF
jgi:hypothetical protein